MRFTMDATGELPVFRGESFLVSPCLFDRDAARKSRETPYVPVPIRLQWNLFALGPGGRMRGIGTYGTVAEAIAAAQQTPGEYQIYDTEGLELSSEAVLAAISDAWGEGYSGTTTGYGPKPETYTP